MTHPRPDRPRFDLSRAFLPRWLAGPDNLLHAINKGEAICSQPYNAPLSPDTGRLYVCPACAAKADAINEGTAAKALQEASRILRTTNPFATYLDLTMIHSKDEHTGALRYMWALVCTDKHDNQHVMSVSHFRTGAALNIIEAHQGRSRASKGTP
jgi:hypothetical protein